MLTTAADEHTFGAGKDLETPTAYHYGNSDHREQHVKNPHRIRTDNRIANGLALLSLVVSGVAAYWATNIATQQTKIAERALVSERRDDAVYEYIVSIDKLCQKISTKYDGAGFAFEQDDQLIRVQYGVNNMAETHGYPDGTYPDLHHLVLALRDISPKMSVWLSAGEIKTVKSHQAEFERAFRKADLLTIGVPVENVATAYAHCLLFKAVVTSWYQRGDGTSDHFNIALTRDDGFFWYTGGGL